MTQVNRYNTIKYYKPGNTDYPLKCKSMIDLWCQRAIDHNNAMINGLREKLSLAL
jgi:hypothetical protein